MARKKKEAEPDGNSCEGQTLCNGVIGKEETAVFSAYIAAEKKHRMLVMEKENIQETPGGITQRKRKWNCGGDGVDSEFMRAPTGFVPSSGLSDLKSQFETAPIKAKQQPPELLDSLRMTSASVRDTTSLPNLPPTELPDSGQPMTELPWLAPPSELPPRPPSKPPNTPPQIMAVGALMQSKGLSLPSK